MNPMLLVLIAFIFIAVNLCWGKLPPGITCLFAVSFLWFTGIITMEEAFANFISGSIITMVSMMILSAGLLKTNLLSHIVSLTAKAKGGDIRILLAVSMLVPFLLCQFTGGVTALITVIPLLLALADAACVPHTSLILPASIGAQLGVCLFPVGLSASMFMLKNQILANCGLTTQFGYWDLCFARLPGALISMLFILLIGYKFLPARKVTLSENQQAELQKSSLTPEKEKLSYLIFCATMLCMMFHSLLPLDMYQIAVLGAILMIFSGILTEREAFSSVSWSTIFMIASMLGVITAMTNSGVGDLLANIVEQIIGEGMNSFSLCAICFLFCVTLTQIMDNQTLVNVLTPIVAIACLNTGISPLAACAAIEVSSITSFMTPMASPASAMTYSMGGYTMKEMFKFCIPVILIQTLVTLIWIPIYFS